jgi:hypothetical protein
MPKDALTRQATREVRSTVVRPQLQALRRAARSGKQDFNEAQQRVAQVTGALLGQLGKIPGAYAGQTSGIIGDVTSGIGALGEQLGQNTIGQVPEAERAAGIANVGAIGSGAIEQIAGQQQNMADYLASGAQQGAVQGAVTSRNYLKDYANFQKDIRQQKVDLQAGSKDDILQRLDQLKQERFDRSMALKQLGMQQAQIDQANRALDAQIKYETAMANLMLKKYKDKHRNDDTRRDDTGDGTTYTPPTPPGFTGEGGFGTLPAAHHVDQMGAFQTGPAAPQNAMIEYGNPQAVLSWIQTLDSSTDLTPARDAIHAWLTNQGVASALSRDGTLVAMGLTPPEVTQVMDAFNQRWNQFLLNSRGA